MSWAVRLSKEAEKQLRRLPRDRQEQMRRSIDEMEEDPQKGDVRHIKSGRFRCALRKREGSYRIIFSIDPANHLVEIAAVLLREEKTYR